MNPKIMLGAAALLAFLASLAAAQTLFPANNAQGVNPDVQLKLTFNQTPVIGRSGKVRIYDAANNRLVDQLDLSIPPGPTERATGAALSAPYLTVPYPYDRKSQTNFVASARNTPFGLFSRPNPHFERPINLDEPTGSDHRSRPQQAND